MLFSWQDHWLASHIQYSGQSHSHWLAISHNSIAYEYVFFYTTHDRSWYCTVVYLCIFNPVKSNLYPWKSKPTIAWQIASMVNPPRPHSGDHLFRIGFAKNHGGVHFLVCVWGIHTSPFCLWKQNDCGLHAKTVKHHSTWSPFSFTYSQAAYQIWSGSSIIMLCWAKIPIVILLTIESPLVTCDFLCWRKILLFAGNIPSVDGSVRTIFSW